MQHNPVMRAALFLVLLLLLPFSAGGAEEAKNESLGLIVNVPEGWETVQTKEPGVAFRLRNKKNPAAVLSVLIDEVGKRTFRGEWTALRYSVVVDQGAVLQGESKGRAVGMPGRVLQYEVPGDRETPATRYLHLLSMKEPLLMEVEMRAPSAVMPQLAPVFSQVTSSLRWIDGKPPVFGKATPKAEASATPSPDGSPTATPTPDAGATPSATPTPTDEEEQAPEDGSKRTRVEVPGRPNR